MGRLDDRVVLITGAAAGQGAAEACMARELGADAGGGSIVSISSIAGMRGGSRTDRTFRVRATAAEPPQ